MSDFIVVRGVRVPPFIYGTAWKNERTEELVGFALDAGFRAFDTANQRKHYFEAGVGAAVSADKLASSSKLARGDLFLQTKFTYQRGQDARLPYDAAADVGTQVRQSFESSLEHLGVSHIDSFLLHGPWSSTGWSNQDRDVWTTMEALHAEGGVSLIGISNVSLEQLKALCDGASVAPAFVQNRCYARDGWDKDLRAFCQKHGIVYQAFSLLTANARELASPTAKNIAKRLGATVEQVVFSFAKAVGIIPLTGTSSRQHMKEDLASATFVLGADDLEAMERIADRR